MQVRASGGGSWYLGAQWDLWGFREGTMGDSGDLGAQGDLGCYTWLVQALQGLSKSLKGLIMLLKALFKPKGTQTPKNMELPWTS